MEISELFRNVIEIGFGLLYLVGAVFNFLYTLNHGAEFYGSFADKAILTASRQLVREVVIPRAKLFTGLLIVFQLLVAVSILSRGNLVEPALIAGAVFCLIAALVSNTQVQSQIYSWLWFRCFSLSRSNNINNGKQADTACSGLAGFGGIFRHFPRFGFSCSQALSQPARPHAGNANLLAATFRERMNDGILH